MKLRGPFYFSLFLVFVVFIGSYWPQFAQSSEKESIIMQTIAEGLSYWHFQPQQINDVFSEKVYNLYLERLDPTKRYLTQKDIQQLAAYRSKLDDEAKAGTFEFFDLSLELVNKGIDRTEAYYKEILSEPFDFSKDESIELDGEKRAFAANEMELKEFWRKYLKYDVLSALHSKIEKQEKKQKKLEESNDAISEGATSGEENTDDEEEEFVVKTFEELKEEARKEAMEDWDDLYERIRKVRRADRMENYLNSFANIFDPHTSYFMPKRKEDFDIRMSGTLEGIGARLSPEGDYVKVASIVVGGPAWKQKELEANDLIYAVAQDGEEPLETKGMHIDDVVEMVRGKKDTKVILTVKKIDGSMQDIPIIRDVVIIDESYAKSVIIDYPGVIEKIGFIRLPAFYADFSANTNISCATDVENEIKKLQAEGAQGIILDLRNNGGGYLNEAIRMTGLFIEQGPVVQVKSRGRDAKIMEDENPKVQYDGPLIVLVNSFSASASEILSAALQDYGRAVIVGESATTYGKGTVQRFLDLDRAVSGHNEIKPLGQVKLTIQKYYRVDGGSVQLRGVTPDIVLPDNYMFLPTGEKDYDYPMEWSEIKPAEFSQDVVDLNFLDLLNDKSEDRVAKNDIFQKIKRNAMRLKKQSDFSNYSLHFEKYSDYQEERKAEADEFKDMLQPFEGLKIANLKADLAAINQDDSKKARNDDWLERLQKDPYLEESLKIMKDMAELD